MLTNYNNNNQPTVAIHGCHSERWGASCRNERGGEGSHQEPDNIGDEGGCNSERILRVR